MVQIKLKIIKPLLMSYSPKIHKRNVLSFASSLMSKETLSMKSPQAPIGNSSALKIAFLHIKVLQKSTPRPQIQVAR